MSGRFIISLDCEGKWGMAHHLERYHHQLLTRQALTQVYSDIVALLAKYDVAATFAFVMAFTLTATERKKFRDLLDDGSADGWLTFIRKVQQAGSPEGWFQPNALEIVRGSGRHEIGCHSFSHRPLQESSASAEEARRELDAADQVAREKGLEFKTFIYPRNGVGHVAILAEHGYIGYREKRPRRPGIQGSIQSLAHELDPWPRAERGGRSATPGMVTIPAGYLFNWRFRLRRAIPPAVTVRRWKNLLERAAATGGVAHLWLHPHNLITGPQGWNSLEHVLAHASRLAAAGRLKIVTQEDYCRELLAERI